MYGVMQGGNELMLIVKTTIQNKVLIFLYISI